VLPLTSQKQEEEIMDQLFVIEIPAFHISIIDQTPEELLFVTISDVNMEYTHSNLAQTVELKVRAIQVCHVSYFLCFGSNFIPNFKERLFCFVLVIYICFLNLFSVICLICFFHRV
jgi:hypothetical protein